MGTQLPKMGAQPLIFGLCQTAGWIKMSPGMAVCFGPGHIVLDEDPAPPKNGHSLHFLADIYCGQTAGWIKMQLGTKVGLSPGNIVFDADAASPLPRYDLRYV